MNRIIYGVGFAIGRTILFLAPLRKLFRELNQYFNWLFLGWFTLLVIGWSLFFAFILRSLL